MNNVKYFVRTTKERPFSYNLEYKELIDLTHRPIESFLEQLEYIDSLGIDAVLLEDDLILCEDFTKCIEEAISRFPNNIINFYTWPDSYFETRVGQHFQWNQCTYYPKGSITNLVSEMRRLHEQDHKVPYDELEAKAIWNLKLTYYEYRPCLVQHIGYKSLISGINYTDTIYFKDYLDELSIDYSDEAAVKNNVSKLRSLLEKTRDTNGYPAVTWIKDNPKRRLLLTK